MLLVNSVKNLWKESVQNRSSLLSSPPSHPPMVQGERVDTVPDLSQAVTLAIIGCGQRGKVCFPANMFLWA